MPQDPEYDDLFGGDKIDYIEERNHLLKDVPYKTVRRAWFTLSHVLVPDGSTIVDMGCGEGEFTYTMAALRPDIKFVGVDKSTKTIRQAKRTYKLDNLSFKPGDASADVFRPNSIDAIINSYILHQVFSDARYNERMVSDTLRKQFAMLKNNGIMFIRDYARPQTADFVLMELHDKKSTGDSLSEMSEADLLVWYAEHARPKQDPGCGGFFLEELPPRFPATRLFRVPYKWAYEFIMRKDNRELWEEELPFEYTFYTVSEFRKELRSLGARVQYSAPHWDDSYIREHFEGHFRLLEPNGEMMGDPPTSFIAVARKEPERSSLVIKERRIAKEEKGTLHIKTVRDVKDGTAVDIVSRQRELAEFLPYRISEEGKLYIYLHDGVVRGIPNSVKRSGINIDGREWSGHMLEAMSVELGDITDLLGEDGEKPTRKFVKSTLGLKMHKNAKLEKSHIYYPDPNFIDERVHTFFVEITNKQDSFPPSKDILAQHEFKAKGVIREFSAQQILDAIAVGLIPNSRLELQIFSLMKDHGVKAENWIRKDISIAAGEVTHLFELREFLKQAQNSDKRFKEVSTPAGQLRAVSSIFVEEGQSKGGRTGIAAEHMDFVLSDDKTINTAVVLPITGSMKKNLHAGFQTKHMPIPERFGQSGLSLSLPHFSIPKDITNYKMLKQFLAEKFGVTPDMVIKMGESFYTHIGMTQQRIHPFAVAAPPDFFKDPKTKFLPFFQYQLLWMSLAKEQHVLSILANSYRALPDHFKHEAKKKVYNITDHIFDVKNPDWGDTDGAAVQAMAPEPQADGDEKKKEKDDKEGKEELFPKTEKRDAAEKAKKHKKKRAAEKRRRRIEGLENADIDDADEEVSNDAQTLDNANKKRKKRRKKKRLDISLSDDENGNKKPDDKPDDNLDKPRPG